MGITYRLAPKPLKVAPGLLTRRPQPFTVGLPKVGRTLKVKASTWDAGVRLSYRWYRGGKAIKGATKRSYQLKKADAGQRIRVKVTATKPGYATVVKHTRTSCALR